MYPPGRRGSVMPRQAFSSQTDTVRVKKTRQIKIVERWF